LAVAVTDLLALEGYQLSYRGGADLDFAGKGKMFKTHGFNEVLGLNELLPGMEDKTYTSTWGIYDDTLLDLVYERFLEKSSKDEKFGIFTLTLDTHQPKGHMSKTSKDIKYKNGFNPMLNAVAGSDYLISNFITKIIQSPYANKTVIVLVSDHLALRNKATNLLNKKERTNLFMIIDPSSKQSRRIEVAGSTLDIAPTILPFIGYKGEVGLGRNLLKNKAALADDLAIIQKTSKKWKKHLIKFWDFPKIQNYLKINIDSDSISIDNRTFKLPVLIELNEELETTLKFEFGSRKLHKTLIEHIYSNDDNKLFLLIDRYKNIRKLDLSIDKNAYCIVAGKGKKISKIIKITEDTTVTKDEIYNLLGL
jgi:phosphoglycerol transferase